MGMLGDFHDLNGNGIKDEGEHYIDKPTVAEYFYQFRQRIANILLHARYIH